METVKKYGKIILNIVVPVLEIAAVCFLVPKLLKFFLPFVIGWIIAMIANPLVQWLEKRVKIVRKHSSAVIVVLVLAGVIGLGYLVFSRLLFEAFQLAKALPDLYERAALEIQGVLQRFDRLLRLVPLSVQQSIQELAGNVGKALSVLAQKMAEPTVQVAGSVAKSIPGALVYTVVTILSSYFFIAEQDQIIAFWKRYLPKSLEQFYHYLVGDVKRLIGGYFLAQFRIMFVVAAILVIGMFVLGVDYALPIAVLIALLDFLPMFGTGTVLIPWALVKLCSGDYVLAIGMALLYVLTQVVRQLIQPKIVGDSMGLPPLLTLVFLYLGFKLHGISGMIVAVPLGMIGISLYDYGAFDTLITNVKILVHDVETFRKAPDAKPSADSEEDGCVKER